MTREGICRLPDDVRIYFLGTAFKTSVSSSAASMDCWDGRLKSACLRIVCSITAMSLFGVHCSINRAAWDCRWPCLELVPRR